MEACVTCALCNLLGSNDSSNLENTEESMKNHARIHFVQTKIIDIGITEDAIFQRCFSIDQKFGRLPLSQIECRRSLLDLCKSLHKHQSNSAAVICNMCGYGITSIRSDRYNLVNHASAHMEIKLFKCQHCECSLSSRISILHHMRHLHKILTPNHKDFEDKTVEQFAEISNMVERCFSASYPRVSGRQTQFVVSSNCRDKSQRSIVHFCRSVFVQRSKPASLECNLCGSSIILRGRWFCANGMSGHAAAHLKVKLFACRHCNQAASTKRTMKNHLRTCHQINDGSSIADFDDRSEKLHSEHLRMIERCFSGDQVKLQEPTQRDKSVIKAEATVRSQSAGSKRTLERRLFCSRLIRKVIDRNGKIQCALCSKRLTVVYSRPTSIAGSKILFSHVERHLRKPLYRCKVCRIQANTRLAIVCHLKKKHALGMRKNHECISDEYHDEIIAKMSECFLAYGIIIGE